jgi:hypothetical protein
VCGKLKRCRSKGFVGAGRKFCEHF